LGRKISRNRLIFEKGKHLRKKVHLD